MDQSPAVAVSQIVSAEGNQSILRSGHMNAASLQAVKVDIPCVLEGHSRDAKRMGLDLVEKAVKRIRPAGG